MAEELGRARVQPSLSLLSPLALKQSSKARIVSPENIQIAHFTAYSISYGKIKLIFHDSVEVSGYKLSPF